MFSKAKLNFEKLVAGKYLYTYTYRIVYTYMNSVHSNRQQKSIKILLAAKTSHVYVTWLFPLQSLMLSIAKGLLEEEEREREEERGRYMAENCPSLSMPRNMQELQARHKPTHRNPQRHMTTHSTQSTHVTWCADDEHKTPCPVMLCHFIVQYINCSI